MIKQSTFIISLIALALTGFYACTKPPCECDFSPAEYVECKIVNQQGQDLVFGPASIFLVDSIEVLGNDNNFATSNASVDKGFYDTTALRFDFHIPATKSYIYYNQQTQKDSLEINWVEKTGKCCGDPQTYYAPGTVKFNGTLVQPQNGVYRFVK